MSQCDISYGPEQKPWKETLSPWAKSGNTFLVTPPSANPLTRYDFPRDERYITPKLYQVPSTGLEAKHCNQAQAETAIRVVESAENLLGYQVTMGNNCIVVSPYLSIHTNSGGDPFTASMLGMHWMERNVLDYYASLWNAKWPHVRNDPETYWGYVLTMGSTEGNLYGLWNARDYLQGKMTTLDERCHIADAKAFSAKNPNASIPVAFYSQDAHYSMIKFMRVLEIQTFHEVGTKFYPDSCPLGGDWPTEVPCEGGDKWNGPGSINISKLCKLVDFFTAKGYPALIIFNYGTTFKGAYDDVKKAGEQLMPILERNGMKERLIESKDHSGKIIHRKGYWIHVDGALGASYMPFVHMALEKHRAVIEPAPHFDFRLPFVCSIVTSGHKFPGAPWPTGIYMTKSGLQLSPSSYPSYIGSPDTTLAGSRNALSTLIWWTYISTHNYDKQVKKALRCLDLTRYAESKLKQLEKERGEDLWVARSPSALNVRFKIPNNDIVYKYTLAEQIVTLKGDCRTYTYLYCMGGTTKEKLDELFEVLRAPDAFPAQQSDVIKASKL